MRLVDRLFAWRRAPAWSDPVQVLLWGMGWAVPVLAVGMLVAMTLAALMFADHGGAFGGTLLVAVLVVQSVTMLVGLTGASWFVSEAYNGWRAGHRHGRQWAVLIAVLLVLPTATILMNRVPIERGLPLTMAVYLAVGTALGIALLVAVLTTKPPSPTAPPAGPSAGPPATP